MHDNVIFSQLDKVPQQQMPDTNDISQNAKGRRVMEAQEKEKGENRNISPHIVAISTNIITTAIFSNTIQLYYTS